MSSTRMLAKSLPRKCPNTERHRATLNGIDRYKFSIYTIAPLDSTSLRQLEGAVNSGDMSTKRSRLAPEADFSNRSLRDVYDCHVRIRDENETVHPLYFIVADQVDLPGSGVLVVHLNCSRDEADVVGVGRCGVDMADSWGANIDIGNQDWLDLKEAEADEWGGEDPYEDSEGDEGDGGANTEATAPGPNASTPTSSSTGNAKPKYGWYSLVQKAVPINSMLEPNWLQMKAGQSRFQMLGNYFSSADPWLDVRQMHPRNCLDRHEIHRNLVLVAEHEDANGSQGTAIVYLRWNGDLSSVSRDGGPGVVPESDNLKRVRASEALQEMDRIAQELQA